MLYHSLGPDTSLATNTHPNTHAEVPLDHVYQYAEAGLHNGSTTYENDAISSLQVGKLTSVFHNILISFVLFDHAGSRPI